MEPCGLKLAVAFASSRSNSDRAFEYLHGGATDPRDEFFASLRDFDFDVTGAPHFFALQNGQRVPRCQFSMANQIRAERSGGGTRGGILVNFPGKHAPREYFAVAAERKAICHRCVFSKQFAQLKHIHGNFAERGATFERHHEIEDAGGNAFWLKMRIEIFRSKA